jgi:signal transduction histidine kinase
VLAKPVLLDQLSLRDELRDGDFTIKFGGDLTLAEEDLLALGESADWLIEIDCNRNSRRLRIAVTPTRRTRIKYPNAEPFLLDRSLAEDEPNIGFQARILQKEGVWPARYQGVRVYFEGFRVLPYGDRRDDWLDLDRDYRSRGRGELGRLRSRSSWDLPSGTENEGLAIQGNSAFFGAVLLTRSGADELQMVVNREGFLPSAQFDFVADIARLAIDLQVRLRYATTSEIKQARRLTAGRQARAAERAASGESPSAFLLQEVQRQAVEAIQTARKAVTTGHSSVALTQLRQVEEALRSAADLSQEAASEATMFRVAASLGLEHAAFVHEVRSLSLSAQSVAEALDRLADAATDRRIATRLRAVAADARELRERLRRNAVYLADVTGVEGRRRRSRLNLRERVERVLGFFSGSIERRHISIDMAIPRQIETPPLFPAELAAIISNLLSNAIKFSGRNGRLRLVAEEDDLAIRLRVENTGTAVDLRSAERWFEPFRSTTADVDESLGQGMGLGLTITRSLLDEYGGRIYFVPPSSIYATAIEVELPRR